MLNIINVITWNKKLAYSIPSYSACTRSYNNMIRKCFRHVYTYTLYNNMQSLGTYLLTSFLTLWLQYLPAAPHSIPHFTREDVQFDDYTIPKHTLVMFSNYSLLMDKHVWGDPEIFRPERFLNESGQLLRDSDRLKNFTPFGLGKNTYHILLSNSHWAANWLS